MSNPGFSVFPRLLLVIGVLVSSDPFAVAQNDQLESKRSVLDLVPSSALAAIGSNDFEEFGQQIKLLCGQLDGRQTMVDVLPFGVSMAQSFFRNESGISKAIDPHGSSVLVLMGKELSDFDDLLLALPIKNMDQAANELGTDKAMLKEGVVNDRFDFEDGRRVGNSVGPDGFRFIVRQGQHLVFGSYKLTLEKAISEHSVRARLSKDEAQALTDAQAVFFVSASNIAAQPEGKTDVADLFSEIFGDAVASEEVDFANFGLSVEDGISLSAFVHLKDGRFQELVNRVGQKNANATLAGLPDGKVITASTVTVDKDLLEFIGGWFDANVFLQLFSRDEKLTERFQLNVYEIFKFGVDGIRTVKFAAYLNDAPADKGLFSVVAILETKNAEKFIKEMTSLESFVNASLIAQQDEDTAKIIPGEEIVRLIEQLGSETYRQRELAMTKLKLLGKQALPDLEKFANTHDVEIQSRIRTILDFYQETERSRQKDALNFKPEELARQSLRFGFLAEQESIGGNSISHIRVGFTESRDTDQRTTRLLREWFGQQWNTIRMTSIGNRILLSWGGGGEFLQQSISQLKSPESGLADPNRFEKFSMRKAKDVSGQFHLSLSQIRHLLFNLGPGPRKQSESAISSSIQLKPKRIRIDSHFALDDIQILIDEYVRRNEKRLNKDF